MQEYADMQALQAKTEAARAQLEGKAQELEGKVVAAHKEFFQQQKEREALSSKLEAAAAESKGLHCRYASEQDKGSRLAAQLSQEREKNLDQQSRNQSLLVKKAALEASVKELEAAQKDLERQLQDEVVAKSKAQEELVQEGAEVERINSELEKALEHIVQLQDRIVDLEGQVERDQLEAEEEAKKLQQAHKQQDQTAAVVERKKEVVASLESKVKKLETELRDTAAEAAKQAAVLCKTKSENSRMEMEIDTLTPKLKKLQAAYDQVESRVVVMDHKLLATQEEVEAQEKASADKSVEIDFYKAELVSARAEVERVYKEQADAEAACRQELATQAQNASKEKAEMEESSTRELTTQTQKLSKDKAEMEESLQRELAIQTQRVAEGEKNLAETKSELQDKTQHLGMALVHIDEGRERVAVLEASLEAVEKRATDLDGQLRDMENLNEELSRQKALLAEALDADKATLVGYVHALQAAGRKFFPDPFPERCHLKIPDRVWLISIEFHDNRKMLHDLLHQTYIEEDFGEGQVHMTALPGGLTKSKVDVFGETLKQKLDKHASSNTGLDRAELESVGRDIWLQLNPSETGRAQAQGAILAAAMLQGLAPGDKFALERLPQWLDGITQMVRSDVDASKGDVVAASRRSRYTLTADVSEYDRSALWVHCCSLLDYMLQSCGRKIANLSPEELRLLQLTDFLALHQQHLTDSSSDDDDGQERQLDMGSEYWKRDSDSTYSQGSFVDRFRMSWDRFQKASAGGFSAPTTPRSHFSVNTISSISVGPEKKAGLAVKSSSSWFMGDHLFEA